jgi:hypothetical protein
MTSDVRIDLCMSMKDPLFREATPKNKSQNHDVSLKPFVVQVKLLFSRKNQILFAHPTTQLK